MALRFVLLALVALMSFELPTSRDLASWSQSSDRWVSARLADLGQVQGELSRLLFGVSRSELANEPSESVDPLVVEVAQIRADVAFEAALEGFVASFRVEQIPPTSTSTVATLASASVETSEPACFEPAAEGVEPPSPERSTESPATADRLASALRLTRDALSAWASLIDDSSSDAR